MSSVKKSLFDYVGFRELFVQINGTAVYVLFHTSFEVLVPLVQTKVISHQGSHASWKTGNTWEYRFTRSR